MKILGLLVLVGIGFLAWKIIRARGDRFPGLENYPGKSRVSTI
jgi:hypothetical protein